MRIFYYMLALALLVSEAVKCQDIVTDIASQLHDQMRQAVKVDVAASIFDGYVISNDSVSANFRSLVRRNFQTSENAIVVTQKSASGDVQINLMPETAEKIAREVEPYVILAERGRTFSEVTSINSDITIKLEGNGGIALAIVLEENNDTVVFRNADVSAFVRGFSNASVDAKGWYIKEFFRLMLVSGRDGD